ncbi:MAG: alpha/beta hydrolase, partial [Chlamydiia bacterium]|nr:alpha/beta hydrolase [Chlamydiia bacterium]
GSHKGYAIFSSPKQARKALIDVLKTKKYSNFPVKTIAQLYRPKDPEGYISHLISFVPIPLEKKISLFSTEEFYQLILGIEKTCGYLCVGNEKFHILPKIHARLEDQNHKELYLIGNQLLLTKEEVVDWILSHRLDGVIVHYDNDQIHIRSRPSYSMWHIRMSAEDTPPLEGEIDTILRIVGEKKENQCIWGFINGVWNSRDAALESAQLISDLAKGEQVFSMPNDTIDKSSDLAVCFVLKCNIDTPVVQVTAKFLRYLIYLSGQDHSDKPIVVFAHSMGAIICEHALELLKHEERQKLHIFTFGGGSFIAPEKCHPDSHNFASARDLVCLCSPNLRTLAMKRFIGLKEGLSIEQILSKMAQEDTMLYLDTTDENVIKNFENQRKKFYQEQLKIIENVTILDPGPGLEHSFCIDCYQNVLKLLIANYRNLSTSNNVDNLLTYTTV